MHHSLKSLLILVAMNTVNLAALWKLKFGAVGAQNDGNGAYHGGVVHWNSAAGVDLGENAVGLGVFMVPVVDVFHEVPQLSEWLSIHTLILAQ